MTGTVSVVLDGTASVPSVAMLVPALHVDDDATILTTSVVAKLTPVIYNIRGIKY